MSNRAINYKTLSSEYSNITRPLTSRIKKSADYTENIKDKVIEKIKIN